MSKRADSLRAICAAGAAGDQAAFLRLYTSARIGYAVAAAEYRRGAAFAARLAARDAAAQTSPEKAARACPE